MADGGSEPTFDQGDTNPTKASSRGLFLHLQTVYYSVCQLEQLILYLYIVLHLYFTISYLLLSTASGAVYPIFGSLSKRCDILNISIV